MVKRAAKVDLSHIHEQLGELALPIADLVPDPANARKHGDKNLAAIKGSLAQYGQRRPAVVQREGMVVRAGNGMLQAAISLGWTHLACLLVDEDNVSATGFAIADNRTAELAEWDEEVLGRLMQEVDVGEESLQIMFADLAKDLDLLTAPADAAQAPPPRTGKPRPFHHRRSANLATFGFSAITGCSAEIPQRPQTSTASSRGARRF